MKLTWLGHSACHIQTSKLSILVDPFFTDNPTYPEGWAEKKLKNLDYIVLTHGHYDHIGDTIALAKAHDATVVGIFELCMWLGSQGLEKLEPMNIGGIINLDGVSFAMVPAMHSATELVDGVPTIPLGASAGFVIMADGETIYHAGDTGIFSDMALIQKMFNPKIGLIPIGDRFTMGPEAAAWACNEFLDLELVIPVHWGTFDMLSGTPKAFKELLQKGEMVDLKPGEAIEF